VKEVTELVVLTFVGPGPFEAKTFVEANVFSDHESVFLSFDCKLQKAVDKYFWERSFKDENIARFGLFLRRQDWPPIARARGATAKYGAFLTIFSAGFNSFFPKVKKFSAQISKTRLCCPVM
jgi:hypothetical protein